MHSAGAARNYFPPQGGALVVVVDAAEEESLAAHAAWYCRKSAPVRAGIGLSRSGHSTSNVDGGDGSSIDDDDDDDGIDSAAPPLDPRPLLFFSTVDGLGAPPPPRHSGSASGCTPLCASKRPTNGSAEAAGSSPMPSPSAETAAAAADDRGLVRGLVVVAFRVPPRPFFAGEGATAQCESRIQTFFRCT